MFPLKTWVISLFFGCGSYSDVQGSVSLTTKVYNGSSWIDSYGWRQRSFNSHVDSLVFVYFWWFTFILCHWYKHFADSLHYLPFTRPDIAFVFYELSQLMHCLPECHWGAVKRLLRYLKETSSFNLILSHQSFSTLHAFSDAECAGNKDDCSHTNAYVFFLGSNPISLSSKKKKSMLLSSVEVEYRVVAYTITELCWL